MYGVYCMDYQYPVVQVSKRTAATLYSLGVCSVCSLGKTGAELTCWFCRRTLLLCWAPWLGASQALAAWRLCGGL